MPSASSCRHLMTCFVPSTFTSQLYLSVKDARSQNRIAAQTWKTLCVGGGG